MPTTFVLDVSPNARSACKKCKDKMPKGTLRIASISESTSNDMIFKSYYHTSCFNIPRTQDIQNVTDWCDQVLEDGNAIMDQDDTTRAKIIEDISSKPIHLKKTITETKDDEENDSKRKHDKLEKFKALAASQQVKRKMKTKSQDNHDDDDDHQQPHPKKMKLTKKEQIEYDVYSMYCTMSNDALQDILRWNLQLISGTKPILLARVMDGQLRGRLTRCPLCQGGKVAIREDSGTTASCTGYFNDVKGIRISCSFQAPVEKCSRLHPWWTEKPSDEEMEQMTLLDDDSKTGKSKTSQMSTEAILALTHKVNALDWKTNTKVDIKAATAAMIAILAEGTGPKVNLPPGRETMAVGKIVAANQSKSAQDILNMIIEQFGFAADTTAGKAKRAELLESTCTVAANAPILMVLLELKEMYEKEDNSNPARAYNKVADVIKDLHFEITVDNVMGMSKGKTKIAGIGKGSAEKIKEFLETGTIAKLEEK